MFIYLIKMCVGKYAKVYLSFYSKDISKMSQRPPLLDPVDCIFFCLFCHLVLLLFHVSIKVLEFSSWVFKVCCAG